MAGIRVSVGVFFVLAISLLALLPAHQAPASTYKPTLGFTANSSTPGTCASVNTIVNIPAGDPNFGTLVNFYPTDWSLAGDAALPNGVAAGIISSTVNISLASAGCDTNLGVVFTMHDADTDPTDELSPAQTDYWTNKGCGSTSCTPDTRGATAASPANGIPDYIDATPYFINDLFDPDGTGPLPPLQAKSRVAGEAIVAGTQIILQFVRFDPGDLVPMNGVEKEFGKEMGYPSVIVLNNPIENYLAGGPSAIGDFCTALSSTVTLYGVTLNSNFELPHSGSVTGGQNNACNPAAGTGVLNTGTHVMRTFSQSQRDIDHTTPEVDGIENNMDTCPYTNSAAWDPRLPGGAGTGDTDDDGIPNDCDPTPLANTNFGDHDFDLFPNRQDNCPLIANGAAEDYLMDVVLSLAAGGTDQVDIIAGGVDVNENGTVGAEDDLANVVLSLAPSGTDQVDIINGAVDVNENNIISTQDNQRDIECEFNGPAWDWGP